MAHDRTPSDPATLDDESRAYSVIATPGGRIASLDGLRAVAIGAVVLGHLAGSNGFPTLIGDPIRNNGFVDIANLGVRIFFVISGFLITGILMREAQRPGGIGLRRFYLRRVMRIFPAYYVFVGGTILLTAAGLLAAGANDVVHALTYTTNYDPDRYWGVGHLWSLAVEEQFYLLWPFAIILVGIERARFAAILVIVAAPIFRALEYRMIPAWQDIVGNTFETTADAIAIGCLLALMMPELARRRWFQWVIDHPWSIALVFLTALPLSRWGPTNLLLSYSITNIATALAVAYLAIRPFGRVGWLLNVRPVVFVGVLSYSIYLWQQVIVNRESTAPWSVFPLDVILVAIVAMASYYLIERPVLRLRPKVERRLLGDPPDPVAGGLRVASPGSGA